MAPRPTEVPSSSIRRAGADDVSLVRSLRLEALLDAPYAYGSTHAVEAAMDEAAWTSSIFNKGAWFIGTHEGLSAGIVQLTLEPYVAEHHLWAIFGMWVSPVARGTGLTALLLEACATEATTAGAHLVGLWVTAGNDRAATAYARNGFGEVAPQRFGIDHEGPERFMVRTFP